MKPARILALLTTGLVLSVLLIFRTKLARDIGLLTEPDMNMRGKMILNHMSFEQACLSWRGAVDMLKHPLDPVTYSDYRGIIDLTVFSTESLENQASEAIIRMAQAEAELTRLRDIADWSFTKSWFIGTTKHTHGRRRCTRSDQDDRPIRTSLAPF